MNYSKLYDKLIALSKDPAATPSERHTAKAKAVQIRKKHLKLDPQPNPRSRRFQTVTPSNNPFNDLRNLTNQYTSFTTSGIFQENSALKEQLKQAIFGVIKERDELKRKGEL